MALAAPDIITTNENFSLIFQGRKAKKEKKRKEKKRREKSATTFKTHPPNHFPHKSEKFRDSHPLAMSRYSAISKRQKTTHPRDQDRHQPLLPGLPDHIAQLCLSHVHPSVLNNVSHSWRRLIYSPSFPPFLSLYCILSSSKSNPNPSSSSPSSVHFFTFDPISSQWDPLPPPDPPLHLLRHHPSFLSRNLPIQSLSVSGKLILLAATTHNFYPALTRPLIFDPIRLIWLFGPELVTPRRWCVAGSLRAVVYAASGIGSQFSSRVARSVEKWELKEKEESWRWEKTRELRDGRFSRQAIDAVGWKGKLCVVNLQAVEGFFYDVDEDTWGDMPKGMMKGWRGPAAAMNDEELYVIDESCGVLSKYDEDLDEWREIVQSELLKGAQHVAAAGGRVCAVCENDGGGGIVVVNVMALPPKIHVVDTPPGFQALTVHILPRMSKAGQVT